MLVLIALLASRVVLAADPLQVMVQLPHGGPMQAIAFTPDGKQIMTGSDDQTAKLWELSSGKLLRTFAGHGGMLWRTTFSKDGKQLFTSSDDGTSRLWDVDTGAVLRTYGSRTEWAGRAVMSFAGDVVFSRGSGGQQWQFFSLKTGELLRTMDDMQNSTESGTQMSPDGQKLFLGRYDKPGVIEVRDAHDGSVLRTFDGRGTTISAIAVAPNSKSFAALAGSAVHVWDDTKQAWGGCNVPGADELVYDRQGKFIAVGGKGFTMVLDATACQPLHEYPIPDDVTPKRLEFSADGRYLAMASWSLARVWETATGRVHLDMQSVPYSKSEIDRAVLSADGGLMTTGSNVWNLATSKLVGRLQSSKDASLYEPRHIAADGRTALALNTADKSLLVTRWDLPTGRELSRSFISNDGSPLAVSHDGKSVILAKYGETAPTFWDLDKGTLRHTFGGHPFAVVSAVFSPDDKRIATNAWTDEKSVVKVWDATSGQLLTQVEATITMGAVTMAFSPSGKLLAIPGWYRTRIFDLDGKREKAVLTNPSSGPEDVALFIDERTVAITGSEGGVRLWDVETGKLSATLSGHTFSVKVLALSADGKRLLSAGRDSTARLWDLAQRKTIATFVSVSEGDYAILTPDNYYAATLGAASRVHFVRGRRWYSFDNFDLVKNRPDVVSERLGRAVPAVVEGYRAARKKRLARMGFDEAQLGGEQDLPECDFEVLRPKNIAATSSVRVQRTLPGSLAERADFQPDDILLSIDGAAMLSSEQAAAALKEQKAYAFAFKRKGKTFSKTATKNAPSFGVVFRDTRESDSATIDKHLGLKVTASDPRAPLRSLHVTVNGVPAFSGRGQALQGKDKKGFTRKIDIELSRGRNDIDVSVMNERGIESLRERFAIDYTGVEGGDTTYVVALGASEYQQADYDLTYAAKDATDVATAFAAQKSPFGDVRTLTLLNKDVTRASVDKIRAFLKPATVDDRVIVFIAGHGLLDDKLDYYLATNDIDFANPAGKGLRYDTLQQLIDETAARRKVLLMDACHSGEVDKDDTRFAGAVALGTGVKSRGLKGVTSKSGASKTTFQMMQEMFADLRRDSGAVVISSASGTEFASESGEWKNGVFTYALLEGLKGQADANKDQRVSVSELRGYVVQRVQALTNGLQTPTSRRDNVATDFFMAGR